MSIKKIYLNDYYNRKCRVIFILPKRIGKNAKKAHVVGEFNNWSYLATPMKKLKNGTFVVTIELPIGREYQFRYLLDNQVWINDLDADRFVPTPFGDSENCVLTTYDDTHLESIKAYQLGTRSSLSNLQPIPESLQEKSSPIETFFSMLTGKLQTMKSFFIKPSLSLKS